jgi:integrase
VPQGVRVRVSPPVQRNSLLPLVLGYFILKPCQNRVIVNLHFTTDFSIRCKKKMDKPKNSNNLVFVDFIPAELKENLIWEIIYYVKNPYTGKLERKRNRVKPLKSIAERRKLAKRMILGINKKLETDTFYFFSNKGVKEFTLFNDAVAIYQRQLKREFKDGNFSADSLRTYNSRIKNIQKYILDIGITDFSCHKFNNSFVYDYLEYLRYTKEVTARTRDNYFTFIVTLSGWLQQKKYIAENPCVGISKINKRKNEKIIISKAIREKIFNYYEEKEYSFLIFCMCCYYCLIRRTELSKIKIGDVDLKKNTMWISAEDSKNNKSAFVTIPPILATYLAKHIHASKKTDFLFSEANYAPGPKKFNPNKATSNWSRMRLKLKINVKIKWYYLKDSGIVDLITAGVPLNSVRDQARHHSISQTNDYIPRNLKNADAAIINSNISF